MRRLIRRRKENKKNFIIATRIELDSGARMKRDRFYVKNIPLEIVKIVKCRGTTFIDMQM